MKAPEPLIIVRPSLWAISQGEAGLESTVKVGRGERRLGATTVQLLIQPARLERNLFSKRRSTESVLMQYSPERSDSAS